MKHPWLGLMGFLLPTLLGAQTGRGPYARIAVLRPHDGKIVDFEAGYIRHLAWHQQARDPWVWYGWSIWAGDRYRWFVYATFGHSAASLDSAVTPAEDERDNVLNVAPYIEWVTNGLYEYLPDLSRGGGTGEPEPAARLEFTMVDLVPGAARAFESALGAVQSKLQAETLWYRLIGGGPSPRYVRLRPHGSLSAVLWERSGQELPDGVSRLIAKTTVEIWTLRPTMSLRLGSPPRP